MRLNLESLINFKIIAKDGEIGKVKDFYFDDQSWMLRYLVVQTGSWLLGRRVLLAFASVKKVDCDNGSFTVDLTCDQVKKSPDIDTDKPVYRQHEMELHSHYMLPAYWMDSPGIIWGINDYSVAEMEKLYEKESEAEEEPEEEEKENLHLRSTQKIMDYLIHAQDGEIGHVAGFIVNNRSWKLRELVIDTRNLLAGRKVLLPVSKVQLIQWINSEVYVNVKRDDIIGSPEYEEE